MGPRARRGRCVAAAKPLVSLALCAGAAYGQTGSRPQGSPPSAVFVHESWTVENGLPVNSINALHQSRDGYLWVATFDGLVRFDGVRFTTYNPGNSDGLPSGRVVQVSESGDRHVWIVLEDGELVRFDRRHFNRLGSAEGVATGVIRIAASAEGEIWVGMSDGLGRVEHGVVVPVARDRIRGPVAWIDPGSRGVARVVSSGAAFRVDNGEASRIAPTLDAVALIREDSMGVPWLAGGVSLYRFREQPEEVLRLADPTDRFIDMLAGDGAVWTARRFGVHRIDGAGAALIDDRYRPYTGTHLRADRDGRVWFASGDVVWSDGRPAYRLDPGRRPSEPPPGITAFLIDREGSIWLGTSASGLHRLKPSVFTVLSREEGLADPNVYPVYAAPSGDVWVGTSGNGLNRVRGGQVVAFYGSAHGVPGLIGSVLEDSRGVLWVGGTQDGLVRCATAPDLACEPVPALSQARGIRALYEDRSGRIWVGSDQGLFRLDGGDWLALGVERGGPAAPVRAFLEARDGALWMATNGAGVVRWANGRFEHVGTEQGLPGNLVRALHEDGDGYIWVGTEGYGLARLDRRAGETRGVVYRARDGLFDEVIHRILEDDAGRLWMSTNRGIFWVRLSDLHAFAEGRVNRIRAIGYTERDGLRNREANGGIFPAGTRTADGRLWFPTQNGVAIVDPATIGQDARTPPAAVERVIAGGGDLVPSSGVLELGKDRRDLEIEYTALSLLASANIWFRHRLDPYDHEWVDAGTRRTATYTRVPPGRYTFRVEASNPGGDWGDAAAVVLNLSPRFHETRTARLLLVIALLLLAASVFQWRLRGLRRHAHELARLVDERTAALRQREFQLEVQNAQLAELDKAKTRFFANVSHEFRTPLTLTIGPLEDLEAHVPADDATARRWLDTALRNSRRLLRLVNQILDVAKLEAAQMKLRPRALDLAAFTRGIFSAFVPLAESRGIQLSLDAPEPVTGEFDPDALEKVLTNLLSNAIKFTPTGGRASVRLTAHDSTVELSVSDSGPGIAPEHLAHVFERFYQADETNARAQPGTGIGLALVKELAKLHGGTVAVENTGANAGATFTVTLPRRVAVSPEAREAVGDVLPPHIPAADHLDVPGDMVEGRTSAGEDVTTLLVVDDSADLRAYLRDHFAERFRVLEAGDGDAGVTLARTNLPDVIVSDVMMPGLDGHELVRRLRSSAETDFIPIILLTAHAAKEHRIAGLEHGADDYIAKPFHMRELAARIDNLVASHRRLRQRFAGTPVQLAIGRPDIDPRDRAYLQRVRDAIEHKLDDPDFGVAELAQAIFQDRSHLYRRVRELLGETPSDLLRRARLERAARLLASRAGTVADVAYAAGFNSVSYFTRAFHELYGATPAAWRDRAPVR